MSTCNIAHGACILGKIMSYNHIKADDHRDISDSEETNLEIRIHWSSISHNVVYQRNLSKLSQNATQYQSFSNLSN